MTRGKYAVRAANRLAEIDAGLVVELREKLAAVTAERDAALRSIDQMRRDRHAEAQRIAASLAADHVGKIEQRMEKERARLADAEVALEDLDKTHTKVWQWAHAHLQSDHGFGYADAFEFLMPIIGVTVGGMSHVGIAGVKRGDPEWISLLGRNERAVAAIQRARKIRR